MATALLVALLLQDAESGVRVETADGTVLQGSARLAPVKLTTAYGEATIAPAKLVRAARGDDGKHRFTLNDGTSLTGTVSGDPIAVVTEAGTLTVKWADVVRLEVGPAPKQAAPAPRKYPSYALDRRITARPLLASDGRTLAIVDSSKRDLLLLDVTDGRTHTTAVEASPVGVAESGGRLYVANGGANSVTVVDLATRKVCGRIALSRTPTSVACTSEPALLYYACGGNTVMRVDLTRNAETGAMTGFDSSSIVHLVATPDNRYLYAQGSPNASPSGAPTAFLVDGQRLTPLAYRHENHQPLAIDYTANRVYGGRAVYTLDLREIVARTECNLVTPHPTLPVALGGKAAGVHHFEGSAVVALDAETGVSAREVSPGETLVWILSTESTVLAATPARLYLVPVRDLVSGELAGKRKEPIFSLSTTADARARAEAAVAEGRKLAEAGRHEDALARFADAAKLDALGAGHLGAAEAMLALNRPDEAIALLRRVSALPFRVRGAAPYLLLARSYVQAGRADEAVPVLGVALRMRPDDAVALYELGACHAAAGREGLAYVAWDRAIRADGKHAAARKRLTELAQALRKSTLGECPACKGTGAREATVEDASGSRKVSEPCGVCRGGKRVWKRPCVDCETTGRRGLDDCGSCWARGYRHVPEGDY